MTSLPISAASRPPCAVLTPGLPVLRRLSPGNPFSPETATRAARSITPNESSPHEVGPA